MEKRKNNIEKSNKRHLKKTDGSSLFESIYRKSHHKIFMDRQKQRIHSKNVCFGKFLEIHLERQLRERRKRKILPPRTSLLATRNNSIRIVCTAKIYPSFLTKTNEKKEEKQRVEKNRAEANTESGIRKYYMEQGLRLFKKESMSKEVNVLIKQLRLEMQRLRECHFLISDFRNINHFIKKSFLYSKKKYLSALD